MTEISQNQSLWQAKTWWWGQFIARRGGSTVTYFRKLPHCAINIFTYRIKLVLAQVNNLQLGKISRRYLQKPYRGVNSPPLGVLGLKPNYDRILWMSNNQQRSFYIILKKEQVTQCYVISHIIWPENWSDLCFTTSIPKCPKLQDCIILYKTQGEPKNG